MYKFLIKIGKLFYHQIISYASLLGVAYNTISSDTTCQHTNHVPAAECDIPPGTVNCEDECTKYSWCIGYSLGTAGKCSLLTPTEKCEVGEYNNGMVATSIHQITKGTTNFDDDARCMGKTIKGKSMIPLDKCPFWDLTITQT